MGGSGGGLSLSWWQPTLSLTAQLCGMCDGVDIRWHYRNSDKFSSGRPPRLLLGSLLVIGSRHYHMISQNNVRRYGLVLCCGARPFFGFFKLFTHIIPRLLGPHNFQITTPAPYHTRLNFSEDQNLGVVLSHINTVHRELAKQPQFWRLAMGTPPVIRIC